MGTIILKPIILMGEYRCIPYGTSKYADKIRYISVLFFQSVSLSWSLPYLLYLLCLCLWYVFVFTFIFFFWPLPCLLPVVFGLFSFVCVFVFVFVLPFWWRLIYLPLPLYVYSSLPSLLCLLSL